MDYDEKRKAAERALKGMKKVKSLEERKSIARQSRARKAGQSPKRRSRRDWSDYDEDDPFEEFERMGRTTTQGSGHLDGNQARSKHPGSHPWRIVAVHAGRVEIERHGKNRSAHLGGKPLPGGPPVVGDRVAIDEMPAGECRLCAIAERRSGLMRQDPGSPHQTKWLAANVDLGLIAIPAQPDGSVRLGLVERMRIALQAGHVSPLVVVTKIDRLSPDAWARLQSVQAELLEAGLPCLLTSAVDGQGMAELGARIEGETVVVAGHSGVGKSTLLNALDPDFVRDTGGVRLSDDRGRHTTTASRMTPFAGGGWLIDTPGIRSFGLQERSAEEWLAFFPELAELAEHCPKGCQHDQADCAIRIAVEQAGQQEDALVRAWKSWRRLACPQG